MPKGGDTLSVVYKQRYNPKANPNTPVRNASHLVYIACRKGVVPNPECGFGLWGRMEKEGKPGNIDNLRKATEEMRELSKKHTVYRVILSLKEETALAKGLVGREEWQRLITSNVAAIAKENDIASEDFRWCAAYHQEKGHPHTHLMFWDSSDRVRSEHMLTFTVTADDIEIYGDVYDDWHISPGYGSAFPE
jgi:hypothetical protein